MIVSVPLAHAGRDAVPVRPLTGADEIALSPGVAGRTASVLAAVIGWDAELDALSIGDRNALLLGVLAATYGPRLSWQLDCPACGKPLDLDLDIGDLLAAAPDAPEAGLPEFRVPTVGDLAAVAGLEPDDARMALLARCVEGELDDASAAAVEDAMAAADPLSEITLVLTCAECGTQTPVGVDVAMELLARITTPADLLVDVHALALAYGWTEPDVLALPRPRRQEYLALIADVS